MHPFVIDRRAVVQRRVAAMRIVPALDEVEDRHPRVDLGFESTAFEQLAFQVAKKLSHMALSKQSPTEPIEGRTLASIWVLSS